MAYERFRSVLVDENETILSVLGNNFAEQFFATGVLGNGFSILSDKRVYFKGKCFVRNGKKFFVKTEEKTVDLEDVTGSGFVYNKNIVATVLFWIFTAVSFVGGTALAIDVAFLVFPLLLVALFIGLLIYFFRSYKRWALITALALPAGIPLLFYTIMKATNYSLFEISFAGGGIGFDVNWISKENATEFQNSLRLAKDRLKEMNSQVSTTTSVPTATTMVESTPTSGNDLSAIEMVKQLKELETQGIISAEEFEKKKKELLGL